MAPQHGLVATLRAVSLDATDALVEALREQGCVAAARVACRGLRQVVDGSVKMLQFSVKSELDVISPPWPSLALWPRVEKICYQIEGDNMDDEYVRLAVEKWTAWAGRQAPACLRRITALRLGWSASDRPLLTASLAASIALWFPNLKELSFKGCYESALPEAEDAKQLAAMVMGGLGRLQHLEKLTLPSMSLLGALGELQSGKDAASGAAGLGGGSSSSGAGAGGCSSGPGWLASLQHLEIATGEAVYMTDEMAAGLHSLSSLRVLRLDEFTAHDPSIGAALLRNLFEHVPPSLSTLSIAPWIAGFGPFGEGMEATCEAGRLVEVAFVIDDVDMFRNLRAWQLGAVAEDLLLPCLRIKDGMLRRLVVRRLCLPTEREQEDAEQPELATGGQLAAIRELVQRCWTVELREVEVKTNTHLPAVAQVVELLGQPQTLRLKTIYDYPLRVPVLQHPTPVPQEARGQGGGGGSAAAGGELPFLGAQSTSSAQAAQPSQQPQQPQQPQPATAAGLPPAVVAAALSCPPQALVARAVQRLLAMPQLPAPAAGESAPPPHTARLLVLRGPLVTGLAQAPGLVEGWVKWLASAAAAGADRPTPSAGSAGAAATSWSGRYLLVPRALGGPVLLLQAERKHGAAAALHAAVRSVEPEVQLEAMWVAVERYPGYPGLVQLPAPVLWCVQQELDETFATVIGGGRCTARVGGAAPEPPASLQDQVQWLQQLGKALAEELPALKSFSY